MSSTLALEISTKIAERQQKRRLLSGLGLDVRRRQMQPRSIGMTLQQRRSMGYLGVSDTGLGLGIVGAGVVVVILLFVVGLYLEYIRFRDGTKWERITQGVAFLLSIPAIALAASGATNPKVLAGLQLLHAGLDGYAAGHQIMRQEHYIANGLALLGDAWGLYDVGRLLGLYGTSLPTVDSGGSNPYADLGQGNV